MPASLPASSSLLAHLGNVAGNVAVALLDAPGHIQRHVWGDGLPTLPADILVCGMHLGGVRHHARQCSTICISQAGCLARPPEVCRRALARQLRGALLHQDLELLLCSAAARTDRLTPSAAGTSTCVRCSQLQPRPVHSADIWLLLKQGDVLLTDTGLLNCLAVLGCCTDMMISHSAMMRLPSRQSAATAKTGSHTHQATDRHVLTSAAAAHISLPS